MSCCNSALLLSHDAATHTTLNTCGDSNCLHLFFVAVLGAWRGSVRQMRKDDGTMAEMAVVGKAPEIIFSQLDPAIVGGGTDADSNARTTPKVCTPWPCAFPLCVLPPTTTSAVVLTHAP